MPIYSFPGFEINARPFLSRASCKCGNELREVYDGVFSVAFFCRECKSVYKLTLKKLRKDKINKEFIQQAMKETEPKK